MDDIVVSGWDFSLEGGWTVQVNGDNATIASSNFKAGANLRPFIFTGSPSALTIVNNVFDGAGVNLNPATGLLYLGASGTTTIAYNWIKNAYYQFIQSSAGASGTSTQLVEYNVFENAGLGSPQGAHGDWIQDFSATPGIAPWQDVEVTFNTFIQNDPAAATQGLSIPGSAGNTQTFLNITMSSNTAVMKTNVNYAFIVDTTWLNGTGSLRDNYVDPTGVVGSWAFVGNYGANGPYSGTVSKSGNINMLDGSALP
jgi:hypothetical protein